MAVTVRVATMSRVRQPFVEPRLRRPRRATFPRRGERDRIVFASSTARQYALSRCLARLLLEDAVASPAAGHRVDPEEQGAALLRKLRRLGAHFDAPFFERSTMAFPALSIEHYRLFMERSVGPTQKLVESIATEAEKLAVLRAEFAAMVAPYYSENILRQDYLLTRAQAR
ncbi:hypothetical protein J2739_005477 [Variovorax soli]|uniref:Uncharacterized protein n=2 Tax=Variovorax soli TaxID=376815 RepID=A0ABU1NMJ0_9BURK|nr:hypothetical protein [Variovorax soli]